MENNIRIPYTGYTTWERNKYREWHDKYDILILKKWYNDDVIRKEIYKKKGVEWVLEIKTVQISRIIILNTLNYCCVK